MSKSDIEKSKGDLEVQELFRIPKDILRSLRVMRVNQESRGDERLVLLL